jgi:NAD(P)H-quinone oxidoreductase subunit 5
MFKLFFLIPLLAPAILLVYAVLAVFRQDERRLPSETSTAFIGWFGIGIAAISSLLVLNFGTLQSAIVGWADLGLSLRLDALSAIMFTMIAILGFIILKFSTNYLAGDKRQAVFMARLATTIAAVELLVLSGNLAQLFLLWIATSVCLHYLLVFYRSRPQAIAAARKKFLVARIGDVSLLISFWLLYIHFGTGDLAKIFSSVPEMIQWNASLTAASVLLVIAALLKSAQFPTHGWLIEVVETPTPVSALLHAGLLNAGPFLIIRMGFLMNEATTASMLLIIVGGFTALFASVVYLTQPTVKVSLGYSSVAHMGFSLLVCGFGVYSAAILHLVAHSFYKAHSFLSSGSVVDVVRAKKVVLPQRRGSSWRIGFSILFVLSVYGICCLLWGIDPQKEIGLMAIGAIIVMGLSQALVQTFDTKGTLKAVGRSVVWVVVVTFMFFLLEKGSHLLIQSQIPAGNHLEGPLKVAAFAVITSFVLVILIQMAAPGRLQTAWSNHLGIHLRNGLYANVIFDRMVGSLKSDKFKWANLAMQDGLESEESAKVANEQQRKYSLINK